MPVDNEKIKIFDADDQSLKILGELLSNDTSRKILKALIEKEMYTNQIACDLDIRVSLVIHHLNKMRDLGIVEINHKKITKKGNNHRYFRVIPGFFVMPNETKEEIEQKGTLKKIFNIGSRFSILGIFLSFSALYYNYFSIKDSEMTSLTIPSIILLIGFIIHTIHHSFPRKRKHH